MARSKTGFLCHNHTSMVSYEIHHIWPREYHGPDTKANKVKICPNAHSDIHYLMDRMLAGKPYNIHEYGLNIRRLARLGYDEVNAYAAGIAAGKLMEGFF